MRSLTTALVSPLWALPLILLLTLSLTGCAAKEDAIPDADATDASAAAETTPPEAAAETAAETADVAEEPEPIVDREERIFGPVVNLHLDNGDVIEATDLRRLGSYYIYLVGKFNGRSSTVVSYTRLADLRKWAAIVFTGPKTLTVVTRDEKELQFTDADVYLGSDSNETFTIYALNPMTIENEPRDVEKSRVKAIEILPTPQAP